jgi:hypothetical protein
MPQYLVAIQHPDNYDPSFEGEAMIRDIGALNQEINAAGATSLPISALIRTQWLFPQSGMAPQIAGSPIPQISFFRDQKSGDWNHQAVVTVAPQVQAAQSGTVCEAPGNAYSWAPGPYVLYLQVAAPDGTQVILRDMRYNGQPQGPSTCSLPFNPIDIGTVFQSSDGTNLTFVASSEVYINMTGGLFSPSCIDGVLIDRSGARYNVAGCEITGIEDRNGDALTFNPGISASGVFTASDSLPWEDKCRFKTIHLRIRNLSMLLIPIPCSIQGAGGSTRTITLKYTALGAALAPSESIGNLQTLFGWSCSTENGCFSFDPNVLQSIVLPDGTSTYSFEYDACCEVARVTLPTGGFYTYRYQEGGSGGIIYSSQGLAVKIWRPLQERDEYSDGVHLSAKTLRPRRQPG